MNRLLSIVTETANALRRRRSLHLWIAALVLGVRANATLPAADIGRTFSTPEEAVAALNAAANNPGGQSLHDLFGLAATELVASDQVQSTNELREFTAAFNATHRIVRESETRCLLEVGPENWPFPIPIVRKDNGWFFDAESGRNELLNRRVGGNELFTLKVMRACVEAQREYASSDHNGDGILEFAQKFISTPGEKDGLFWEPELDGTLSPLGPLVAYAHSQGYSNAKNAGTPPQPFHGYYFKVLTRQGKNAAGGKYDYIINGHMIAGFGLVAWPANYGESGVMTFIVNQHGKVYQKDLGPKTDERVTRMKIYNPDATWVLSPD